MINQWLLTTEAWDICIFEKELILHTNTWKTYLLKLWMINDSINIHKTNTLPFKSLNTKSKHGSGFSFGPQRSGSESLQAFISLEGNPGYMTQPPNLSLLIIGFPTSKQDIKISAQIRVHVFWLLITLACIFKLVLYVFFLN